MLRKIAIVYDLENVVPFVQDPGNTHDHLEKTLRAVKAQGFSITELFSVARINRHIQARPRERMKRVFAHWGGWLRWVPGLKGRFRNPHERYLANQSLADKKIMREIRRQHYARVLPPNVLLLTQDGDFVPIVKFLTQHGYTVTVCGKSMSKSLIKAATKSMTIIELHNGVPLPTATTRKRRGKH